MYTKCVAVIEYLQNNTIKTSKAVFPKSSKFSVFVSNNAVLTLSLFVHDFMQFYNHQINEEITVLQLAYVTTMAYIYRLSLIASNNGYNIKGFSDLKNMCAHLILPDFLAQYIEAIGTVTTSAGVSIVPFTGQYEDIFPENSSVNLSPAKILGMAGRSIPSGPWAIDKDWISAYLDRAIEAHETGMEFRVIDYNSNSDIAGKVEMLVSVDSSDAFMRAYSPIQISEEEAHLGASYCYRDFKDRELWLGENNELLTNTFASSSIDINIFLMEKWSNDVLQLPIRYKKKCLS